MFDESHLMPESKHNGKNGGYANNGGYIMVKKHSHPHKNARGYVMLHRLVMEVMLGRYLSEDEIVHHIDGDKHNNNPNNLELLTKEEHIRLHNEKDRNYSFNVDREQIKNLYEKGLSARKVAEIMGIGKSTVAKYIKEMGISRPQMSKRDSNGKFKKGLMRND